MECKQENKFFFDRENNFLEEYSSVGIFQLKIMLRFYFHKLLLFTLFTSSNKLHNKNYKKFIKFVILSRISIFFFSIYSLIIFSILFYPVLSPSLYSIFFSFPFISFYFLIHNDVSLFIQFSINLQKEKNKIKNKNKKQTRMKYSCSETFLLNFN